MSEGVIRKHLLNSGIKLRTREECNELNRRFKLYLGYEQKGNQNKMIPNAQKPSNKHFDILARDGFRCRYCGGTPQEDGVKLIVEHIIPKSQGGKDNTANLITACQRCNTSKSNKILITRRGQIPSFIAITTLG